MDRFGYRGKAAGLERRLLAEVSRASGDYGMIEPGDHVLVGVSGGKDSYSLLDLLMRIQRRAPFKFSLVAVNVDQGHPGYPRHVLEEYLASARVPFEIVSEDTYSIVKEKVPEGKAYCSLCSRLRRGILYSVGRRLGATKIALGHHRDDLIETLLLNLFYSGQVKAMAPHLTSDDGDNVVIRPLCYSSESDIAEYARLRGFPILPCDLCGSQDNLKRQRVKQLIGELHRDNPNVRGNLFAALSNVRSSHLLLGRPGALSTSEAAPRGEAQEAAPARRTLPVVLR